MIEERNVVTKARRRWPLSLSCVVACAVLLSGCVAPSQQYATDKADGVFFTVPLGWKKITQSEISAEEAKSTSAGASDRLAAVHWQEAYTPDKNFKINQILSLKTPDLPIAYARVRSLLFDEINGVSYNTLRNLVVPLTNWASGADSSAPSISISDDSEIVERGARGIHNQYTFRSSDGKDQTIDQSALMSADHSTIYVFIVRCSAACFTENRKIIDRVVKSFTVRGPK